MNTQHELEKSSTAKKRADRRYCGPRNCFRKAFPAKRALEDPQAIDARVQARLKLIDVFRRIMGEEISFDGKSDDELKLLGIKKLRH